MRIKSALVFLGCFQKRSFTFALSRLNPDRCILHSAYMDARLPLTVFFYIIFLFFISIFDAPHFPWNLIRCKAFAVFPVNRGWYLVLAAICVPTFPPISAARHQREATLCQAATLPLVRLSSGCFETILGELFTFFNTS